MNPALTEYLAAFDAEIVLGQVLIRRAAQGFELRHVADRDTSADALKSVPANQLRSISQFTSTGAFRPLKSAPNLRQGWRTLADNESALELALNQLYPGAIADWFAARSNNPPITSYRDFTARQTGMYRITTLLDDTIAAAAIRACCHPDFCLKRRLWSVTGLDPDSPQQKSIIPCLEPCAVLLEFARKTARLEQEPATQPPTPPSPDPTVAECDFDSPANSRRMKLALEKQAIAGKVLKS